MNAPNLVHAAAEMAARQSYGKLVAWLAWKWRDVCAAEDALSDAFVAALKKWPEDGIPHSPEAWLLTVAKRNLLMAARRKRLEGNPQVTMLFPDLQVEPSPEPAIPDERLRLMFVCAHPAIDRSMHSALMLQLVLGVDAARIANAFLLSPSTLSKRLTRAKAKIRDAGIPFNEPEISEFPSRVESVLEAIYGAYTITDFIGSDFEMDGLTDEALFLAQLTSTQMPEFAEAHGLKALLLFCESRRPARCDAEGTFVPLDRQDTGLWHMELVRAGESALARAAQLNRVGPYQIEAAIQSVHMQCAFDGKTRWLEIRQLYEHLLQLEPTIGARIGHAIAVAKSEKNPEEGLKLLDAFEPSRVAAHQPWWATRADLLCTLGRRQEADEAYSRAIALTSNESVQKWLTRKQGGLSY